MRGWLLTYGTSCMLFAHWAVEPRVLVDLVPPPLSVDTYEGRAWVTVEAHRLDRLRLRGTPALPIVSTFQETALRTYVTYRGVPAVWFMALDVPLWVRTVVGRAAFAMPYHRCKGLMVTSGDVTSYWSLRSDARAELRCRYHPTGDGRGLDPGIKTFLMDRETMFLLHRDSRLMRADTQHSGWSPRQAAVEISVNTVTASVGIDGLGPPDLAWYADGVQSRLWRPRLTDDLPAG